jgi:hypothetical protein
MFVAPRLPGIRWSYVCARCVRGARPGPLSILLILASLVSRPATRHFPRQPPKCSRICSRPILRSSTSRRTNSASTSRMYGGIHYRSDIEMGKEHGKRIAGYTVRFARLDGADR